MQSGVAQASDQQYAADMQERLTLNPMLYPGNKSQSDVLWWLTLGNQAGIAAAVDHGANEACGCLERRMRQPAKIPGVGFLSQPCRSAGLSSLAWRAARNLVGSRET